MGLFKNTTIGSGNSYPPISITTGIPQDFTASWVDIGPEIEFINWNTLVTKWNIDINTSVDVRFRILLMDSSGGSEFKNSIETTNQSNIQIENEFYEFNKNEDSLFKIKFDIMGDSYGQLQIKHGSSSGTVGQVIGLSYTKAR